MRADPRFPASLEGVGAASELRAASNREDMTGEGVGVANSVCLRVDEFCWTRKLRTRNTLSHT